MKEFKSKPLIGLEDFSDDKYSIFRLSQAEKGKASFEKKAGFHSMSKEERIKLNSRAGKTRGSIIGKANVESGHLDNIRELAKEACYIPVLQCDKNTGEVIKEWKGSKVAAIELNIRDTAINNNLKGLSSSSGGFIWKYKNNLEI